MIYGSDVAFMLAVVLFSFNHPIGAVALLAIGVYLHSKEDDA